MLTPTVRRTLAPRGQTPIDYAWERHDRISALSALTISPLRKRLGLIFELLPDDENVHGDDIVAFIRKVKAHRPGPLTIIWDRSATHRSTAVKTYLAKHPEVVVEQLPPYAPELNPDEGVWRHTKYARLANYAPPDLGHLRVQVTHELLALKKQPLLLDACIRFTKLPLRC